MSYEILVGLQVVDDCQYERYRTAMKPILADYQGRFIYDFKISEVLISEVNDGINRVFTLNFSCKNKMESFFSDPKYLKVKEEYFISSVGSATILSGYDK
ncbi:MAG: DUF1330 domain-containing protein [Colwellia sp.]|nr:DUF1330 domain-containing protein [Colwellia sp.]